MIKRKGARVSPCSTPASIWKASVSPSADVTLAPQDAIDSFEFPLTTEENTIPQIVLGDVPNYQDVLEYENTNYYDSPEYENLEYENSDVELDPIIPVFQPLNISNGI